MNVPDILKKKIMYILGILVLSMSKMAKIIIKKKKNQKSNITNTIKLNIKYKTWLEKQGR